MIGGQLPITTFDGVRSAKYKRSPTEGCLPRTLAKLTKEVLIKKKTVVGLFAFLLSVISLNVLASDEAHHIKDVADCKTIIEHHCAGVTAEKDVEMCLVGWYEEHHLKNDADAQELIEHKHCADLVVEPEQEMHH